LVSKMLKTFAYYLLIPALEYNH